MTGLLLLLCVSDHPVCEGRCISEWHSSVFMLGGQTGVGVGGGCREGGVEDVFSFYRLR